MEQKLITVPFDLEKAKQITNGELEGKIVTRDGRNARIICWDAKNSDGLVVLVLYNNGEESIVSCKLNGMLYSSDSSLDLMLQLPEYLTFKDGDVITDDEYGRITMIQSDIEEKEEDILVHYYADLFKGELEFYKDNVRRRLNNARLATESEKNKLIEALKESDDKRAVDCLKKLGVEVKPKCEFTAGQPVIGMDGRGEWRYDLFSHYKPNKQKGEYVCTGRSYKKCLPYEGNEHLLGTNKSAEE